MSLKLPVNKKTIAATLILAFLFLVVAGVLVVKVSKANPWIIFKPATPIPGTIPPIITLFSPQNNTAYASNNVYLSFNVTKPQPPIPLEAGISFVKYTLDDNITGLYFCDHYSSGSPPGIPEFSYSHNLTIPDGKHTLVVYAAGVVLPGDMTIFWVDSNVTVLFSVGPPQSEPESLPSPSPSPSSSFPSNSSPSLSPSTQETENELEPQPFTTTLVVASVASVAVVSAGLLVYFKKRNHKG
jgi:hypothetical protein